MIHCFQKWVVAESCQEIENLEYWIANNSVFPRFMIHIKILEEKGTSVS